MNLKLFQKMIEDIGTKIPPDDDWMPVLIVEKEGKGIIFGLAPEFMKNDRMKDVCAVLMSKTISMLKPDAACFMSTAWMSTLEKKQGEECAKSGVYPRPSLDPNRIEIVVCVCMGRKGESDGEIMMTGDILRRRGKHPIIKKWKIHDSETECSGRFPDAMREGFDNPIVEEGEEWKTM